MAGHDAGPVGRGRTYHVGVGVDDSGRGPAGHGDGDGVRAPARVVAIVLAAVLLRTFAFLYWEQASFDADQAVTGLMAKHLVEGRAFPLFFYGQHYMLAVQAWLAAPFFAVFGPTVFALKLPLFALNALTAALLVQMLARDVKLPPVEAFLAASCFVLAPPGTAGQLMSALGASVEPFLYVVLIWRWREKPLWQGLVLGVGFLHREFAAYGFVAFVAVSALDRSLFTRARLLKVGAALAAAAAVWIAVSAVRPYASGLGPGSSAAEVYGAANNVRGLMDRVCGEPGSIARGFATMAGSFFGLPLGLTPAALQDFYVNSRLAQGHAWAWPLFALGALAGSIRVLVLARRRGWAASVTELGGAIYLALVGVVAAVAYTVGRCGELHPQTIRYLLLAILAPVGLAAAWLRLEDRTGIRRGLRAALVLWALASVAGHVRLLDEYVRRTPPSYRRELADALVARNIRLIRTDYWTGYHVAFLSQERVVAETDGVWRIIQYHRWAEARPHSVYFVGRTPCANHGFEAVKGVYWVCDPPE